MAKRSKAGKQGRRPGSFIAGLAMGLVLAFGVYPALKRLWSEPPPEVLASNPSASPTFDFYDILERGEEVVEETLAAVNVGPASNPAANEAETQPSAESPAPGPAAAAAQPASTAAQPASAAAQPARAATPSVPAPQPPAPRPVATPGMYVLQVGAFTREQEAEALKARLALVGMDARIQPVRIDRQTYYRVRIGPTSDLAQLNADRGRLQEHRFDSILLKLVQ